MTAAKPDSPPEAHSFELRILPPEAFPDVATVRRFFASPLYRNLLEGIAAVQAAQNPIPEPVRSDGGLGALALLNDLQELGRALALPDAAPLSPQSEEDWSEEEVGRQLRGIVSAMALDECPLREIDPVGALARYVEVLPDWRRPLDFGDGEAADGAA